MRNEVVGIDLGTTTTLLSVYFQDSGAEVMENDQGKLFTPSVVSFEKKELLLPGDKRKPAKVGHIAETNSRADAVIISDAKRIIGKRLYDSDVSKIRSCFKYPLVADTAGAAVIQISLEDNAGTYSNIYPQVVSAEILKYMSACYKKKFSNSSALRAVVTIPAVFKETQRAATYEAARIAGIDIVQLVSEPTAAAVQYICGEPAMKGTNKNGRFLVFDLGGGTLDVSIVEVSNDGKKIAVKAVDGDPLLGGRDFDNILAKHLDPILKNKYDIDMDVSLATGKKEKPLRERAKKAFLLECRSIKEALSSNDEAEFNVGIFSFWKADLPEEEVVVTRADFEKEITNNRMSDRIFVPVTGALKKGNLRKEDITAVLLAGGGCRMPIIKHWLGTFFGPIPILQARNVDHVVSQGAAIMGHNIAITESNQVNAEHAEHAEELRYPAVQVIESLNHSLGIQVVGDKMGWILQQGTPIPAKHTKSFTNNVDNQRQVILTVKQGASEIASENLTLYETDLNIAPLPARTNNILVTFEMDSSQMLSMSAYDSSIPTNVISYKVPLPGRIDEKNISRMANGDISVAQDLNPIETQLKDLTTHFYKTCDAVQSLSNILTRKFHATNLGLVESFVLNARGDSISVDSISRMKTLLKDIDDDLGREAAAGISPMQARGSGSFLRFSGSIRKL